MFDPIYNQLIPQSVVINGGNIDVPLFTMKMPMMSQYVKNNQVTKPDDSITNIMLCGITGKSLKMNQNFIV